MRSIAKKLWVLGGVLPALALSGCISFSGHFGTKIRVENIPRIENGVTTREQVMSWFGPPSAFFNPTFLDVIFESEEEIIGPGAAVLNDVYTYRYIENKTTNLLRPDLRRLPRYRGRSRDAHDLLRRERKGRIPRLPPGRATAQEG